MTDRVAALGALSLHEVADRDRVIADFYTRFASDPLVDRQVVPLQATIPQPGTLAKVRELTAHQPSSLANPKPRPLVDRRFAQSTRLIPTARRRGL